MISNITSDLKKRDTSVKFVIDKGFICLSCKKTDMSINFVINILYKWEIDKFINSWYTSEIDFQGIK